MKKFKLLITLLVMLVASSSYAQDSYCQAVKDFWTYYAKDYVTQIDTVFKSTFKSSNDFWFESGDLDLDQLADRYLEERFMDYMTDYILPKVKELGVSEAALRENVALSSSPEGKTYAEHLKQLTDVLKEEMISIMIQDSLKVVKGDTSDPVQIKTGIDAGYVEKYKKIMDDDMVNFMQSMFDQYTNLATMILKDVPDELTKVQNNLTGLKTWLTANVPAIAINNAYGIITEDDLDFVAKMKALGTHKLMSLLPMNGGDMMSMGSGIILDYMEWMENHGAVLKEYMKGDFLEMLKKN